MDILKIRRRALEDKQKAEAHRDAPPPATSSTSSRSSPPPPAGGQSYEEAVTLPPGPALPPLDEEDIEPAPRPSRRAPASATEPPQRTTPRRSPKPARPRAEAHEEDPLRALDPLGEFLARYDAEVVEEELFDAREVETEHRKRFLAFDLNGEGYALSILDVREILKAVVVTQVPRAPSGVLGVLSKRGVVMPVVDLAAILGLRPLDKRLVSSQRILTVGRGPRTCGFRVDRVYGVVSLPPSAIGPVPAGLEQRTHGVLSGLARTDTRYYTLLEVDALLDFLLALAEPNTRAAG